MMARMQIDYKMFFWKLFRMKLGSEIIEILQKSCCNTKFFHEITFYH